MYGNAHVLSPNPARLAWIVVGPLQRRLSDLLLRGVAAGLIGLVATALVLMNPTQPRAEAAFGGITNGSFETPGGPSGQLDPRFRRPDRLEDLRRGRLRLQLAELQR